ncbi:MAG TPA: sodium-dependent transporter [Savagea sp.]
MSSREQFSSKLGFMLAAAGSAVGIGAIWKFPYMAGSNGGSVFILLFIACIFLISLPVLIAEFMIGRRGQADAVTTFKEQAPSTPWFAVGILGTVVSALILSFYSVVGGWILSYLMRALTFSVRPEAGQTYETLFATVIESPWQMILAHGGFMLLTILIVQAGIKSGIEKAGKIMMPALFVFFIILVVRSLTLDGAMEGVRFMFVPDWSHLTWETVLLALGQAFFTLSVGISIMITYASYLGKNENIGGTGVNVAAMNIFISLLAGLVIFPAVFAFGFEPDQGPGLVFVILPAVFEQIPFGSFFLIIFFILLLFATITSAISLLEMVVSTVIGKRRVSRARTAWIVGIFIFLLGIPSALSFGSLSHITIFGRSFFDLVDFVTNNIGMPLGALFISIFVGYYYSKQVSQTELNVSPVWYSIWRVLIRYVAPVAIIVIFIQGIS